MTERLSHELAALLAEDAGRSDRVGARGLLRARLARSISEGLEQAPEPGVGEAGTIDPARVAAYLDCSVSRAERDAVAAKLAQDPVVRSDVTSAVRLLGTLEAPPEAIPAGLVARAVGILAMTQAPAAGRAPIAIWWRRPATWSAVAAVLLVAVLAPAVVSMVRDRDQASTLPDAKGASPSRGVVPSSADKGKDARSCDDAREPAKELRPERSAQPPPATMDDDPCRPPPAGEDARKPGGRLP
jgi:hypothetical protein